MKKSKICIFNIIANDYIPQQSLFTENLRKVHGNEFDQICIFLEEKPKKKFPFKSISINEIKNIKNLEYLKFKYDVLELSTALKPYIFLWLFKKYGYKKVIYFDSDIVIYNRLDLIIEKLQKHEVILTPHIKKQIKDTFEPGEIDFTKSGYFNLGFIAFRNNSDTIKFLEWWMSKTSKYGYIDFKKFYFVDQRWIDYAPIFLNSYIIKDPGYNVAYFNLQEYVNKINPKDVFFIHFSGFDKNKVSAYQSRFNSETIGEYAKEFNYYGNEIAKRSLLIKTHKYTHDYFKNGVKIGKVIKNIFKDTKIPLQLKLNVNKPFNTIKPNSIYKYLITPNIKTDVINLFELIYLNSENLKQKFPNLNFMDLDLKLLNYINWFIKNEEKEHSVDKKFIKIQQRLFSKHSFLLRPFFLKLKIIPLLKYISLLKLKSKVEFVNKIYLYLLQRPIDKKTFRNSLKIRSNLSKFKLIVIEAILKSQEFKLISDNNRYKNLKYKVISLFFAQ